MIYLTKSENSASIINRSNDCEYPEKSIYRTYLFSTVKLIRFGAVFIVILIIVIPVFTTSSDSTIISKQHSSENALELIHNNFVQTEPGYQGFINTEKLQRINPETETNAAPMILSGGTDKVTFNESGLPSGEIWYVNLSGNHSSGPIVSHNYTFHLANNSYSYSIGTPMKIYHANGGIINVSSSASTEQIRFNPYVYQVNLTESGLARFTCWSVNFNGSYCTSFASMTFNETNGTYHYKVCNLTFYNTEQQKGIIVVNGQSVNRSIVFVGYAILKGVISPSNAVLNVNGTVEKLNESGTFCLKLKPGLYNITVSASGYDTVTYNGCNLSIAMTTIMVNLQHNYFSPESNIILGVVIFGAVFLIAVIVIFLRNKAER